MRGEEKKNETIRKKIKQALRGDLELGKKTVKVREHQDLKKRNTEHK